MRGTVIFHFIRLVVVHGLCGDLLGGRSCMYFLLSYGTVNMMLYCAAPL